jgi:hypothetical protein
MSDSQRRFREFLERYGHLLEGTTTEVAGFIFRQGYVAGMDHSQEQRAEELEIWAKQAGVK